MKRLLLVLGALSFGLMSFAGAVGSVAAQIKEVEPAFSASRIGSFGVPTLEATGGAAGFTFSTTQASAGKLHVALASTGDVAVYLDFMQMPEGLDSETAIQQALLMARDDVPSAGWTYGGGSYAFSGGTTEFIVDLTPGTWQLAASYQPEGGEEIMTLTPFTVVDGTAVSTPEIVPDVTLELQDVAFGLSIDPVAAGPQLWHVTNSGEQPRQMVLFRTPRAFTPDDFAQFFQEMEAGTPSAEFLAMTWVAYTAVASPGYGTMVELDLKPGIYTATSWVVDPETQLPALLLGMVQSFTVA